jgi:hypothetical protein
MSDPMTYNFGDIVGAASATSDDTAKTFTVAITNDTVTEPVSSTAGELQGALQGPAGAAASQDAFDFTAMETGADGTAAASRYNDWRANYGNSGSYDDGTVDAADYVVWRETYGTTFDDADFADDLIVNAVISEAGKDKTWDDDRPMTWDNVKNAPWSGAGEDLLIGGLTTFDTSDSGGTTSIGGGAGGLLFGDGGNGFSDPGPQSSLVLTLQGDRLDPASTSTGWFRYQTVDPSNDDYSVFQTSEPTASGTTVVPPGGTYQAMLDQANGGDGVYDVDLSLTDMDMGGLPVSMAEYCLLLA